MPGGFPLGLELCNGSAAGADTTGSQGTIVSWSVANTKGAFVQLIASTVNDASWIDVDIAITDTTSFGTGVDIAVGGAGSEVVIINNLIVSNTSSVQTLSYLFPCQIPAGTRISARAQGDTGADHCNVAVHLFDGAFTQMEGASGADSIGFLSASTTGTTIDPGGTANTLGTYVQLTASTSKDYLGFCLGFDPLLISHVTHNTILLDIAVGGAGSEVVIFPQFFFWNTGATYEAFGPVFIPIPSGTRVAARAQSSTNVTPSRTFGLTLYGIYQ